MEKEAKTQLVASQGQQPHQQPRGFQSQIPIDGAQVLQGQANAMQMSPHPIHYPGPQTFQLNHPAQFVGHLNQNSLPSPAQAPETPQSPYLQPGLLAAQGVYNQEGNSVYSIPYLAAYPSYGVHQVAPLHALHPAAQFMPQQQQYGAAHSVLQMNNLHAQHQNYPSMAAPVYYGGVATHPIYPPYYPVAATPSPSPSPAAALSYPAQSPPWIPQNQIQQHWQQHELPNLGAQLQMTKEPSGGKKQGTPVADQSISTRAPTSPPQSSSLSTGQPSIATKAHQQPVFAPLPYQPKVISESQPQVPAKPLPATLPSSPEKATGKSLGSLGAPQLCRLVSQVSCTTNLNQRVAMVGSAAPLGTWDVSKALLLATDGEKYPVWTAQVYLPSSEANIEYKYIKLTTNSSQTAVEWEPIGQNRELDCQQKASLVVSELFGEPGRLNEAFVMHAYPNPHQEEVQQPTATSPLLQQVQLQDAAQKSASPKQQTEATRPKLEDYQKAGILENEVEVGQGLLKPVASGLEIDPQSSGGHAQPIADSSYRRQLKQQLKVAFPLETQKLDSLKSEDKKKKQGNNESDTTSNASGSILGSKVSSFKAKRRKSLLIQKKHTPRTVKFDPNDCIIQVTHQLPYRLSSKEDGQFVAEATYQSPALLYANLDELAQTKTYNFVWVGIVVTKSQLTTDEEEQADRVLAQKNCYAIYYTEEQINPYLRFYEGIIRPNMHNFLDPSDHLKSVINEWAEFKAVNARVARRVHQVRSIVNSKTIWIHGDQFMLVPYYVRQSEKLTANIGFYFHQAFPASAVFQCFYRREELLQSLLHSDLIGFHIWEYARNFINSCQRLLGLYYELGQGNALSVDYHKRSVQVRIQHIGLDESFVQKIMNSQKYEQARLKVDNTVKNAALREQQNIRASLSRGNFNQRQHATQRSASQPMLLGAGFNSARYANSITSTLASSFGENSSQGMDSLQGKVILASIDSCHQMTGLILKLKGYYRFLKTFPEYREKVVLFQVIRGLFFKSDNMKGAHEEQAAEESKQGQGGRQNNADQSTVWLFDHVSSLKKLNLTICKLVNKIRNEFGRQCLIVESGNWTIHMRLALWSKAQALFVSTLKDGLYLTCFEYIFVKYLCNEFENSAMVLSEFTGCNSQFAGFYDFNPFQLKTTVAALEKVLKDSPEEKCDRMKRAFLFCRQRTFRNWVETFLKELKLAYGQHQDDDTRFLFQGLQAVQFGRGATSPMDCQKVHMPAPLDIKQQAFQAVTQRKNLIIIDHEALPFKQLSRSEMCPRTQIIHWLQEICYDKNNIVVIFSDRHRNYVSSVFDSTLMEQENFWVAAESGYWLQTNKKQWSELFKVQDKQWMATVKQIMAAYCENIDGAVVDEQSCTVIWNYKNAEEEHGCKFANELAQHLQHLIGRQSPIEIVHGNGFIEVLPKKLNKKAVFTNILQHLQLYCNHQIESILLIGGELSDNRTFQFMKDRVEEDKNRSSEHHGSSHVENRPLFSASCKTAICVLGNRPSTAQYFVEQKDVQYLLQEMAFKTQSRKRTKSWANLLEGQSSSEQFVRGSAAQNSLAQLGEDSDSLDNVFGQLKTPPKARKMKLRHQSQTCLFQGNGAFDKAGRLSLVAIDEPIDEMNEEDDLTQKSEKNPQERDLKDPLSKTLDQLSLSGYEAGGSVHKNHSSEQVTSSIRATKAIASIDCRNLMESLQGQNTMQTSHFGRRQRVQSGAEPGFFKNLSLEASEQYYNESMEQMVTSPLMRQQTHENIESIEAGRAHESASMPQLKAKPGATNIQIDFTAIQKGTIAGQGLQKSDSIQGVRGAGTNNSSGGNSGSATRVAELGFMNVESLEEEEGKDATDQRIEGSASLALSSKNLSELQEAVSE